MTRDWERALPTYIKLLRVLWAENRMALGSGTAFGKSAKGVRPQPLPSGGQASLKALVTPLPSAPPHDVGRIHPTQFSRHHVLADLTLSICRLLYDISRRWPRKWLGLTQRPSRPSPDGP
jgi:hypothetical protein